jgi:predicted permease
MAVRAALGAGRGRLAMQLMTESLLLAMLGGVLGLAVAVLGVRGLLLLGGGAVPRAGEVAVDPAVLGFAAAAALLTGVTFGLAPALRLGGTRPAATLREGSRGASGGRRFTRIRSVLVAAQVGLALMLLAGAAVLGTSMHRLVSTDLGISDDAVLTFELNLPASRYDGPARAVFHRRLTERLAALPGVRSAAATSWLPATGSSYNWGTFPLTGPDAGTERRIGADQRIVTHAYFETLDIALEEGRLFAGQDDADAPPAAVISRSAAAAWFPGASAVGQRIRGGGVERDVVGVVADVARDTEGEPIPHVYHLHQQYAERNWTMNYLLAAGDDPLALLPAVRREVASLDPRLVVHRPAELADVLGRGRDERRFAFVLTAVFAGLALLLAVLGLYGVLAYSVGQRRREIGIRLALGAEGRQVAGLVVRQGLAVTTLGLALGLAGALALPRVLASLVYETSPGDPRLLAAAAGVLACAALAASLVPALRATRVEVRGVLEGE